LTSWLWPGNQPFLRGKLHIGGHWVDGEGGAAPLPVIDPCRGESFDQISNGSAADGVPG